MTLKISPTTASDTAYHWRDIACDPPPQGVKLQLIHQRYGVAAYGTWKPTSDWTHWAPLPTFKPTATD